MADDGRTATGGARRRVFWDQTVALTSRGYRWAPELLEGSAAARIRLLGRPAVLVSGPAGVRRFYDDRLQRRHAVPAVVKLVLFGRGAVHGLDGPAHHRGKSLFVGTLTPASVADLGRRADEEWQRSIAGWTDR